MELPFQVTEVPADAILKFPTIQVGPSKFVLPANGRKFVRDIYDFQPRRTDVIVMGFTRSGTTVTQEMVWMICNDFDLEKINERPLTKRFPSLEHKMIFDGSAPSLGNTSQDKYVSEIWKEFQETQGERFMKTHLPFGLLSPHFLASGAKVIYLIRDPKEIIVSNYKLCVKLAPKDFDKNFEKFWIAVKTNRYTWTPFFQTIAEAWQRKRVHSVLLLSYRGFVQDKRATIKLVANFLEKDVNVDNFTKVLKHLNKKHVKEQDQELNLGPAKNENFVRNEHEWKNYFAGSLETEVNAWVEQNLRNYNLPQNLFELQDFRKFSS